MSVKSFVLMSFDVESTGLSTYNDELTQIGCGYNRLVVNVETSTIVSIERLVPFVSICNPECKELSKIVTRITGLTKEILKDGPPAGVMLHRWIEHSNRICSADDIRILIAYNGATFDVPICVGQSIRSKEIPDIAMYFRMLKITYFIDALVFARTHFDATTLPRTATGRASWQMCIKRQLATR